MTTNAAALFLLAGNRSSIPAFVPETGRLSIIGKRFYTDTGTIWQWRGVSMFLLYARFTRGEDITPQLRWMQRMGANVARVFGCVPWGEEWEFFRLPPSTTLLGNFFTMLAAYGLRCEFVPNTYAGLATSHTQDTMDVAKQFPLVFVEIANEPDVNRIDSLAIYRRLHRVSVLTSLGIYDQPNGPSAPWETIPRQDYETVHSPRDNHWPRNAKDLLEIQNALGCPVMGDEPWGAGERDKDGGGSRRTQVADFRAYFGVAHMFAAGATYHFQAGLEGRVPRADEPIQQAIADAIRDVWAFIPPEAQLGAYRAPHLADFPVRHQPEYSQDGHAYASVTEHDGYVVFPRSTVTSVTSVNGWRQVAQLGNEIFRIIR